MKDPTHLIMAVVFALMGACLALLVFVCVLGGFDYVFLGRSRSFWRGGGGLLVCLGVGLIAGWASYRFRHREFGPNTVPYEGAAGGFLFSKRLMVLLGSAVACYYIWDLARGL